MAALALAKLWLHWAELCEEISANKHELAWKLLVD